MTVVISSQAQCIRKAYYRLRDDYAEAHDGFVLVGKAAARLFGEKYDCTVEYGDSSISMLPDVIFSDKSWVLFLLCFPLGPDDTVEVLPEWR